ncbi:type II toxin-antitoxin system VapC family toxin [Phyllobacterium sp. TAF24]|jgi:predicted nucleic acid-binding protein|uniref:type II toxin-antitoxin system VapC family toxin n=1 Tax=unclassified Phyllobacterium TaxID=2638441 RepID=UPI000880EF0B|nr:type II toxin-antitoxin system VapC family toxin [Phyllobacterium sp. OV277]SDP48627.1 Predicted nucleic acid-binding protein, contains PIN domain [Phyllobacterium sp. OV277]
MDTLIIDASIAIKWVVEEEGTEEAVKLRGRYKFAAPDLLVAECANILWKKVQRNELVPDEARLAARLLQRADIELISMRGLLEEAAMLAILLGHPAYDCIYLALAKQRQCRFVTADERLRRVIQQKAAKELSSLCVSLDQINKTT